MTGAPTKVCTFNGPHTNINSDPGSQRELDSPGVLEVLHAVLSREEPPEGAAAAASLSPTAGVVGPLSVPLSWSVATKCDNGTSV